MDLIELRKRPHLSASAVAEYIECGLQYRLKRVDRLKPQSRPDALEFGSAIHKAIAEFNFERLLGNKPVLPDILASFEKYWRGSAEGKNDIQYKDGSNFDSLLNLGKLLIATYFGNLPDDDFKVIGIEEPFSFTIEGLPFPIIGAIDLMEEDPSGTIIVSDLKTAAKAYSADEVDRNFQLSVYHMAAKANGYAGREVLLRFDCLIKTAKPRLEQYYTTRDVADTKRATKKILEVWAGIQKGVFVPNDSSWKCKGCAFKEHCNEWFQT